jgi:aryl-alcohol dehydrogenase-like predicted oxidoreductase
MKYKLLGKSGLKVSELALGTMTFGEEWGWGASKDQSAKIFDAFAEEGGNFIDTAEHYTNGTSEKFVGEFIKSDRDRFVVATKYSLNDKPNDPNAGGNHRKSMIQALDKSLDRLDTDYIDIYFVHAWDGLTPIEEIMRALDDQVRFGKILYIGFSDAPAWVVSRANTMAQLRGWTPFTSIQVAYNLVERSAERELMPMAKAMDIGVTVWSPLAGGLLTGKFNAPTQEPKRWAHTSPMSAPHVNDHNLKIAQAAIDIAFQINRSPSQVAINWIRQKKNQAELIPIIAGRNVDQFKDDLNCLNFELSPEHMKILDDASAIELGFPYDFLCSDYVQKLIHGDTLDKLEVELPIAA